MKRELKNLYNQLQTYKEKSSGFFGSGISWTILYLFLRRHDDVKKELDLTDINYDLKKYSDDSETNFYPFDDIVKPFYKFLKENNSGAFDGIDLNALFDLDTDISSLPPEEVLAVNTLINDSGIDDFSLNNFTIEEFDEFFCRLIQLTERRNRYRSDKREVNAELAKFIGQAIPSGGSVLTIGDDTGEIPFHFKSKNNEITLSNSGENYIWYYLRVILSGKDNLKVEKSELLSLVYKKYDFVFINPWVGKISSDVKNQLKQKHDFEFKYQRWESFFTRSAVDAAEDNGKIILLLPESFLYQQWSEFKKIRKELVESKHLKNIIRLPRGLFKPVTSIRYVILEIDNSIETEEVQFIDGAEIKSIISPKNKEDLRNLFNELDFYWNGAIGFYPYVTKATHSRISSNDYSLAFSNFLNVSNQPKKYIREREEKLISLSNVLKYLKLKSEKDLEKVPILSISGMAESTTNYKVIAEDLSRRKSKKPLKKLDQSAILLGKIKGSIKPTYFEYRDDEIYLNKNIVAFEVPEGYDPQYLIHELRSEFTQSQFNKIETASTIPSFSTHFFSNIYLRIPPLESQKEIVAENLQQIAKEKIKEIEGLSDDLQYIEKEVFSSFAHDFGKILLNVSSNIEVITNYLKELDYRKIISMKDSALFEEKAEKGESIGEVITRLNSNFNAAQEFLENEVGYYTGEKKSKLRELNLVDVIFEWINRQSQQGYSIVTGDAFTPLGNNTADDFVASYQTVGNKSDLFSVFDNLLTNAKEHGFKDSKKNYHFAIYFQQGSSTEGNFHFATLHVGNDGKPFPEDFACNDLFKIHHKGPESTGMGKGGYSIKRRLDKIGASIKCNSDVLSKDKYPVQFNIRFKPVEI